MMRRAGPVVFAMAAAFLIAAPASSADPPGTPHCSKGWHFDVTKAYRTKQRVIQKKRVENRTKRRAETTFTSKESKTIGWSANVNVGGGIDAILFSVKAEVDGSVTRSETAETGVSVTSSIPRKSAVVGKYGVFMRPVTGILTKGNRYSRCLKQKRVKVKLPAGSGWRIVDRPL